MEILHAPWRKKFVIGSKKTKQPTTPKEDCIFCEQFNSTDDEDHFVLKRYKHVVVMLNRYPYNAGHLLILPTTHTRYLHELDPETQHELILATSNGTKIVKEVLKSDGSNIGANQGDYAGGSIPAHFHMHVLPRRKHDTNFLPLIADTKVISFDMHEVYNQLKPHFPDKLL